MEEMVNFNFWFYCVALPIVIIGISLFHYYFPSRYSLGRNSTPVRPLPYRQLTKEESKLHREAIERLFSKRGGE